MKQLLENGIVRLYPSDWRYSAAIVGIVRYFKDRGFDYNPTEDYIEYEQDLVLDQNSYLLFAEEFFKEKMHHITLLGLLENSELSEEQVKLFNEKLAANSICKKVFPKMKFSDSERTVFVDLIKEKRLDLISETFRNADSMYNKFLNSGKMFSESGAVCRINGYYVDTGRKTKSLSYYWDTKTFVFQDEPEFDFIPFGFTKTREAFFINNNYSIDFLVRSNDNLLNEIDLKNEDVSSIRKHLFFQHQQNSAYLDFDVEIITKSQDDGYFKTSYIRKKAIEIFKNIKENEYNSLLFSLKLNDQYYINIEKQVIESILNGLYLDGLIENLIKKMPNRYFNIETIIKINSKIYGGEKNMDDTISKAKNTAYAVKQNIDNNKIKSYRQKLISAITFKDYDRFCQILLQLSDYSGVIFNFAYDLFDDFEKNKNIAYAFVNGLNEINTSNGGNLK